MSIQYLILRNAHERLEDDYDELFEKYETLKEENDEMQDAVQKVFGVLTAEESNRVFAEYPELRDYL